MVPIVVGIVQIVWAVRQFRRFDAARLWRRKGEASPDEKERVKGVLKEFVKSNEHFASGLIKARIKEQDFLSFGIFKTFCGQLTERSAILVEAKLRECLCVSRESATEATIDRSGAIKLRTELGKKLIVLGPASLSAWKTWVDVQPYPGDIDGLA